MSDLAREKRRKTKDWSELSEDLLAEISGRIVDYKDFERFRLVCRSWKLAASMDEACRRQSYSAFLLLFCRRTRRLLYDLTSRQPCDDLNVSVHKSFRQSGIFSSQGWVVVETMPLRPLLQNPVDGTTIKLPDLKCARCYGKIQFFELLQAVISSDPAFTSDYTVILMAIVSNDLDISYFLWQAGGGNLPGCNHPGWLVFRSDELYFDIEFVSLRGTLAILLIDGSIQLRGPKTQQLLSLPISPYKLLHSRLHPRGWCAHKYFVESQRGLMVIVQDWEAKEFHVFELDWESKEWTQVEDLGCRALFLKPSQTPTLLHDCNRFLANKIYYLSSSSKVIRVKIYNLATKLFEPSLQVPGCHPTCVPVAEWIFQTKIIKPDS